MGSREDLVESPSFGETDSDVTPQHPRPFTLFMIFCSTGRRKVGLYVCRRNVEPGQELVLPVRAMSLP